MLGISEKELQTLKIIVPVIIGIVTTIWAFYKFYYTEAKEKKLRTSHLIVNSKLTMAGEKESFHIIELHTSIINKSKTKMYVLSDYINIFGITKTSNELSETEFLRIADKGIADKEYASLDRFVKLKEKKVVYSGKVFDYDDYWWLEPEEELVVNRFVYVPNKFDYAKMIVNVYYTNNKDWLDVETFTNSGEKGLSHKVIIKTPDFKGQEFDWHNKEHLELHNKFRNAEINNTSLLYIKQKDSSSVKLN